MQSLELHKVNAASQCERSLTAFLLYRKFLEVAKKQKSSPKKDEHDEKTVSVQKIKKPPEAGSSSNKSSSFKK